jgi:uncharacterized protein (DUF2147 family)
MHGRVRFDKAKPKRQGAAFGAFGSLMNLFLARSFAAHYFRIHGRAGGMQPEETAMKSVSAYLTFAAAAAIVLSAAPAMADPSGVWLRDNGNSRVRIAKCGDAYCGTLIWVKDPESPSKAGQRIFYDMKENGANSYSGKAFNPEDGKTYAGKLTLSGASMTTSGCALGGLICRSVSWRKAN